jgi:hypothetical protein
MNWTQAMIDRCAKRKPIITDGWAWHCYDIEQAWTGIGDAGKVKAFLRSQKRHLHTPRGFPAPAFCTEYGVLMTGKRQQSESAAAEMWNRALAAAKRHKLAQIVAWQLVPTGEGSPWDTSIMRRDGSFRPAFDVIANR